MGTLCENDRLHQIQKATELLQETNKKILFSEEMVLVDGHKSWIQKLEILNQIFGKFPHKILLTLRRPWDCAFSLYVELHSNPKQNYSDFYEFWEDSNQGRFSRSKE